MFTKTIIYVSTAIALGTLSFFYMPLPALAATSIAKNANGFLTQTLTKDKNPYFVTGGCATNKLPAGQTLTIEPGVIIKFETKKSCGFGQMSGNLLVNGNFIVNGSPEEPVIFTSWRDDEAGGDHNNDSGATVPKPGDWLGIRVERSGGTEPVVSMHDAIIRYAETGLSIYNGGGVAPFSRLEFASNSSFGITTYDPIVIHQSSFHHNGNGGINAATTYTPVVDATENWWGDDSGPKVASNPLGKGDTVRGTVLYSPWTRRTPVNTVPTLALVQSSGFITDGVEPNLTFGSTTTLFSVLYTDGDGAVPQYIRVVVSGTAYDMTGAAGDITQGNTFSFSASEHTFNKGIYTYHFEANDGVNTVRFPESGELSFEVKNIPVILVPGILGSEQKNGVWVIDPILHTYDNLLDTLRANGYEDMIDLFPFPYDWHQSNVLTAFQLHQKIDTVKEMCLCNKVDVVAHSMGGLASRQYAQSNYYENDINQLIFLGTPHLGAPNSYLTWEAGEFGVGAQNYFAEFIFGRQAKKEGYKNLFDFVRNRPVTSVQELLPVFNYLKESKNLNSYTYPNSHPKNIFLENLNGSVNSLLNSNIQISNIIGDLGDESTLNVIRITTSTLTPLWEDGYPDGYDKISGDQGLEYGNGDGTVPLNSSRFIDSDLTVLASEHSALVTDAQGLIIKKLIGFSSPILVNKWSKPGVKTLIVKILSPADIVVIAPDGKRVGKDFTTGGEVNEIEGAFYSGFETDNEYIAIPNPLDGEYKVQAQGTGNGGSYTIASGVVSEHGLADEDYTAHILPNQISEVAVAVDSKHPHEIVVTPADSVAPEISILSPTASNYLRSERALVSFRTSDADSGIASQEVRFDGRIIASSTLDLFWERLGNHTVSALATDFAGNHATTSVSIRVIATASSTISDINRAYELGWIKKPNIRDNVIEKIEKIVRWERKIERLEERLPGKPKVIKTIEKIEQKIDTLLARQFPKFLEEKLEKNVINQQVYDILLEDIEWLLNN